jgi:hypothetical protein
MSANRRIAAGIDQRVRQLAGQHLSDSALVDQMVAYMADLQALWNSTTDEELDVLCEEYPGFVRYATVMENLSKALRTGVGIPAQVKQLPPLPESMREPIQRLLTEGAAIERRLQQQIDDSRRGRSVADDIAAVEGLLREWGPRSAGSFARCSDLTWRLSNNSRSCAPSRTSPPALDSCTTPSRRRKPLESQPRSP